MATDIATLRVHVAPLGFEADRITVPLERTRADRLWLLAHDGRSEDLSGPYLERVKKECRRLKVEVKIEYADRLSLFAAIRAVKGIIEKEAGNDVYVNVASGSKIQAIACMMACMAHRGRARLTPFYAEPERYAALSGRQQSTGVRNVIALPRYELRVPRPRLLRALAIVAGAEGGRITKKAMAQAADEQGIISVNAERRNYSQARFASLDKNIIAPLEHDWGFIGVEKVGRNRWIRLTEEGRNAAEFLI